MIRLRYNLCSGFVAEQEPAGRLRCRFIFFSIFVDDAFLFSEEYVEIIETCLVSKPFFYWVVMESNMGEEAFGYGCVVRVKSLDMLPGEQ